MLARELLNLSTPSIALGMSWEKVLRIFEREHFRELAILDGDRFLGFLSQEDLPVENMEAPISDFLSASESKVQGDTHLYDVLRVSFEHGMCGVAVEEQNVYRGTITLEDMVGAFAKMSSSRSPGVVLQLRMQEHEYHLQELVGLIEGHGTKILAVHLMPDLSDVRYLDVHIKISARDALHPILSSLNRKGYQVNAFPTKKDSVVHRNIDTLMRYLDI